MRMFEASLIKWSFQGHWPGFPHRTALQSVEEGVPGDPMEVKLTKRKTRLVLYN